MGNMCESKQHFLTRDTPTEVEQNQTQEAQQLDVQLFDEPKSAKILDASWSRERRFQELAPEGSVLMETKPRIGSSAARQTKKELNRNINSYDMVQDTLPLDALQLPSGDVCKGNWAGDRKMYKKAKIYLSNGGYFVGQMNQSEPISGLLIYSNGDYYQGGFKGFQANGYGTFVSKDGYEYQGYWKNDKMHHDFESNGDKAASYKNENEFNYNGYFKNGQKSGQGTLEVKNVFIYEGQLENDKIHGKGKLKFLDGSERSYEGDFENNKKEGEGKFLWPKLKAEYKGQYKDDLKHGKGKMTFWNGATYEGDFQYDKMHGDGCLTLLGEGKSIQVSFEQGRLTQINQGNNPSDLNELSQAELFQLDLDDYEEALPQIF